MQHSFKLNELKPLYESQGEKIYERNFIDALRKAGVNKGDLLCVHSFGI